MSHTLRKSKTSLLWHQSKRSRFSLVPHDWCKPYVDNLRHWRNGKRNSMLFAIAVDWKEGKAHIMNDCFCILNLKVIHCKNKLHFQYSDVFFCHKTNPHRLDLSDQMVTWIMTLIPNIVAYLLLLEMMLTSKKMTISLDTIPDTIPEPSKEST